MKRTTLIAIGVVTALVVVPTVVAVAQNDDPQTATIDCPYSETMQPGTMDHQGMMGMMGTMGATNMGMTNGQMNGMGLGSTNHMGAYGMGNMNGVGPEDCPMHDEAS